MTAPANELGRGSGASRRRPEPNYLAVGRVARPFGLLGELKVRLLTEYPDQLDRLSTVYLGPEAEPWTVKGIRLHKNAALLMLVGCDDRSAAEKLRGALVQIAIEDAMPLEEEEFFEHQIVGMTVVEQDGTVLGRLTEIISTGANDVYVVVGSQGELLLPAIKSVILEVDLDADQMVVQLLEGLR
jgi:16S rRNA processing protein RimM